jgi:hypothetical protein
MNNELMHYSSGQAPVPRSDRGVAKRAKAIYDETRVAAMKADAGIALGAHIMEGVVGMEHLRRQLAGDDIGLNLLLSEIQQNTIRQVGHVQRNLFNDWGF